MADQSSNLNITVTTDDAGLKSLIDKLNAGQISVADFGKAAREVRSELVVGSQAQKDYGDMMYQVSQQSKSAAQQQNGLIGIMKQDRQERRLGMFAVMESTHALEGLTGKENEFSKAITSGAQTVFGMKFALEAMGVATAAVWPIALAIGAWMLLKGVWGDSKKELIDLKDEQLKEIDILIELGRATKAQKLEMLSAQIAEEQTVLSKMQTVSVWNMLLAQITGGKYTGQTSALDLTKQKEKVESLTLAYKKLVDEIVKSDKTKPDIVKSDKTKPDKDNEAQQKTLDAKYQLGIVSAETYRTSLMQRALDAAAVGYYSTLLELKNQIAELDKTTLATNKANNEIAEKNFKAKYPTAYSGKIGAQEIYAQNNPVKNFKPAEIKEETNEAFKLKDVLAEIAGYSGSFHSGWSKAFSDLITGTQNVGQAFESMGKTVVNSLENMIAEMAAKALEEKTLGALASSLTAGATGNIFTALFAMFAANGGDVYSGSELKFAANGMNVSYGNGVQPVITGERGPELTLFGKNGARILNHANTQSALSNISNNYHVNNSSNNAEVVSAIASLANSITPASASDIHYAMIKQSRIRNNGIKF